jgi:sugar lactone lactonase YvrE
MMFAAFAVAQNSAPSGAIVVTAQDYPLVPLSSAYAIRGVETVPPAIAGQALGVSADRQVFVESANSVGTTLLIQNAFSFQKLAGNGRVGFSGDGGLANIAELDLSAASQVKRSGVAIGPDGTVYIADTRNGTIRAVAGASSSERGVIRSIAGKWAAAQNVKLVEPMGIAVDRAGNLYIADHGAGAVSVLTKATGVLTVLAHVASPASLAVTADGSKVFVASPETGGVFSISTLTRGIATVSGFAPVAANSDGTISSPCAALESNVSATAAPAAAPASSTSAAARAVCSAGLAVDGSGNLFVADANNGNILRVDAATNKTTEAAVGMLVPGDIAFDTEGDLFVSEQGRDRVIAMGGVGDPASSLTLTPPAPPAGCPQGASFTFCNEPTAGASSSFAFTVRNTSATTVSNIVISPAFVPAGTNPPPAPTNFTTTSTSCTGTLTAGSSCVINVAFTPLTPGPLVGQLVVSDGIASDTVSINLAGTGDDFSLAIAPGVSPEVTVEQGSTATWSAQLTSDSIFGTEGEKVTLACPTNLPFFTTCSFTPCPVTPTVGGTTAFSILVHTSTETSETPPIPNPCNSTQPAGRMHAAVRAGVLTVTSARPGGSGSRFAALLSLAGAMALLAFGYFAMRATAVASTRRAFAALVLTLVASGIVAACHKGNDANSTATPVGITTLNVTASAVDSSGNSLRASRGVQITLDVLKQTATGPLP